MKQTSSDGRVLAPLVVCGATALFASTVHATVVDFTYTQNDSGSGAGTISPFVHNDPGGPINFSATPLPAATVVNPSPGTTPAGFVASITAQAGAGNEPNAAAALTWAGSVTATGTRGADTFTMQIPLVFAPKQTQAPDVSDYNWNIAYGDSATADAATSAAVRMAIWMGRDTIIDNTESPNLFQRYTQDNKTFVAGAVDTFTNTATTTAALKDAEDPAGVPLGTDAAGRDLALYFGWRDTGGLSSGTILIDSFQFGGLLQSNDASLTQVVPEPSSLAVAAVAAAGLVGTGRRTRRRS